MDLASMTSLCGKPYAILSFQLGAAPNNPRHSVVSVCDYLSNSQNKYRAGRSLNEAPSDAARSIDFRIDSVS